MATTPAKPDAIAAIESVPEPNAEQVPFELFQQPDRRVTQLINGSPNESPVKSQNRFFPFTFKKPLFITGVDIYVNEFVDNSLFIYRWTGIDGIEHSGTANSKNDIVSFKVYGVAIAIAFQPPRAYFVKPFIQSVAIFGFELEKSGEFIAFAETINNIKSRSIALINRESEKLEKSRVETAALQAQRGSLKQDIDSLKSTLARENAKLKNIEAKRTDLTVANSEAQRTLESVGGEIQDRKHDLQRMASVRSKLSKRVEEKRIFLRDLEANIYLFPSELSSFAKQGAKDSKYFLVLSAIPIFLIFSMFGLLIYGAADLTTKITGSNSINIAALAVSRGPYVVISCTIITVCYYIARMLILESIRISRQRLSLTKISIIAKDISASIDSDLSLTDDERYNRRLKLKMDLMRDHLQEYLSKDFEPSMPKDIVPSGFILGAVGASAAKSEPKGKSDDS